MGFFKKQQEIVFNENILDEKSEIIKLILKKRIKTLLSVFDTETQNLIIKNCFITGGCISSIYHNETINDIDLYFKNNESKIQFIDYLEYKTIRDKDIHPPVHNKSHNAITIEMNQNKYQFIHFITGTPKEITNGFDFLHCTAVYDLDKEELVMDNKIFECINNKQLIFNINTTHPINSILRIMKLSKRNWKLGTEEIAKLALAIKHIPCDSQADIINQFRGMYGMKWVSQEFQDKFKEMDKELHNKSFNSTLKKIIGD